MKLVKMLFRNEEECSVEVLDTWEVRWYSRDGDFHSDINPEIRVFPSLEDAKSFKSALEDAYKLLRYTSCNKVSLSKTL